MSVHVTSSARVPERVLILEMPDAGCSFHPPPRPRGYTPASMAPPPPLHVHSPDFAAVAHANAKAIMAVAQADADAIRLRADAENQAFLARTKTHVEVERILQEYRNKALEAEASRLDRLLKTQHGSSSETATATAPAKTQHKSSARLPQITPVKAPKDLPSPSSIRWDLHARAGAKHLREIVADRAPSKAQGARLWGKMMEMPTGTDNIPLHVRIMVRYTAWAYWTEAGFLFHPSCIKQINKELDAHSLEDHLQWVLAN